MKLARLNNGPEIFFSIQGEGKSAGRPSVFVRSSLCNLYCVWCDTDYTWNWQGSPFRHVRDQEPGYTKYDKQSQIVELAHDDVAQQISAFPCRNVVMTGGEPLLQQSSWIEVMRHLRRLDDRYWFEVETNGTILPLDEFDQFVNQYNVSPKTANSEVEPRLRERSDALHFLARNPKSTFKFVVREPEDLIEITSLVQHYCIAPDTVYLMPEGTSSARLRERQQWLAEICKSQHFNFSDRLHVHIWGAKRGI